MVIVVTWCWYFSFLLTSFKVLVEPVLSIPSCNRISVDPLSANDWEILVSCFRQHPEATWQQTVNTNDFSNNFHRSLKILILYVVWKGVVLLKVPLALQGYRRTIKLQKKMGINRVFCLFKVLGIQSLSSEEALLCCNLKSWKWAKRKCIHEGLHTVLTIT